MPDPIPFSGDPLWRASNERRDPDWVKAQLDSPESRYLPIWNNNPLVVREERDCRLVWLDASVLKHTAERDDPLLIGVRDGVAHFAIDLSPLEEPLVALGIEGAEFPETRSVAADLPMGDAGTVAHARALVDWQSRHRFCPRCGNPTHPSDGGSLRKCESCSVDHFPRTDPVVIMVAWNGDRAILGRQRAWPPSRYSALAGYIDQGETIEEAVRREVMEEVGLEVDEVVYRRSQPWPFPSALMIGCFAHVTSEQETVDPLELDGARWFTREELRKAVHDPDREKHGFEIPGPIAIAHHIIKEWSDQST